MGPYVIIKNSIIKQKHLKKTEVAKKKISQTTKTENKTGLEANFQFFPI